MTTPSRWPAKVYYDGACPLCSREAKHYMRRDRHNHLEFVDIAGPGFDAAAEGLDPKRITEVMHARTADGRVYTELRAFVVIWDALPAGLFTTPARFLFRVPGVIAVVGIFYRWFARNRYKLTGRCTPESCAVAPAHRMP